MSKARENPHRSHLYERALRLLARRHHTRLELRRKLLRNASAEAVEGILEQLERKGLLNDEFFAIQRALHRRQHRLWGNRRIAQDLKRLGINARMVQRVLQQVDDEKKEAESLREAIHLWIEKAQTPEVIAQLKKLYDHCVRLGYSPALVREHLESYFERLNWGGDLDGRK